MEEGHLFLKSDQGLGLVQNTDENNSGLPTAEESWKLISSDLGELVTISLSWPTTMFHGPDLE